MLLEVRDYDARFHRGKNIFKKSEMAIKKKKTFSSIVKVILNKLKSKNQDDMSIAKIR